MIRIGIDLGGTAIKYGLTEDGNILCSDQAPTPLWEGYDAVLDAIVRAAEQLPGAENAEAVGMAVPGLIDTAAGTVLYSNNFGWENRPIVRDLAERFRRPVRIANDAQAAALGEALHGAGRGFRRMAMLTVGTGVGGGFVKDGALDADLYGGMAFIFGHLLYRENGKPCNCGRNGCYEAYASAPAVEKHYLELSGEARSAREIFESAGADPLAAQAVAAFTEALGALAADLANALRPEVIVIGGGVSGAADLFLPEINRILSQQVYGARFAPVRAVPAALGNRAGILGAGSL